MALSRLFQLFVARETQPGVAISDANLFVAGNATLQPRGKPELTYNQEQNDRDILKGSLSPSAPAPGATEATITFSLELGGTTGGGQNIPWGVLLEACGLASVSANGTAVSKPIGAITSGPFIKGETVYDGASNTAIVAMDTYNGMGFLRYHSVSASFGSGSETLTGVTSGATAPTSLAGGTYSYFWEPRSTPVIELDYSSKSGTISADHILIGATSGAVISPLTSLSASATVDDAEFRLLSGTPQASEVFNNQNDTGQLTVDGNIEMEILPSVTIGLIEDGRSRTMYGCRGNVRLVAEVGQIPTLEFEFKGRPGTPGSRLAVSGVTPIAVRGPTFTGTNIRLGNAASTTYGAEFSPVIRSLTIDLGNDVQTRRDANATNGIFGAAEIVGRTTTGSIDIDVVPEGQRSTMQDFLDGDAWRLRAAIGSAAYNKFYWNLPYLTTTGISGTDTNGFAGDEISFRASANRPDGTESADREVSMFFVINSADTGF